jgi:hypothetical protein
MPENSVNYRLLRNLRWIGKKPDPGPLPAALKLAEKYGIDLESFPRKSPAFARTEAGLARLRKELREKAA